MNFDKRAKLEAKLYRTEPMISSVHVVSKEKKRQHASLRVSLNTIIKTNKKEIKKV
ncbi:hypothetical protein KVC37_03590 [Helicobacter pylori]|nr:hypothetical protein KVC37_03590 [Helicobacter pylori]